MPILFAGMVFAICFSRSHQPDVDLGFNIAGSILGGLAEYSATLLGFQYLVLVALLFYFLSMVLTKPMVFRGSVNYSHHL
jgi:hypothetical protein